MNLNPDDTIVSSDQTVSWYHSFSDVFNSYLFSPEIEEFEENLLQAYIKTITVSWVKVILQMVGILVLVLWPVDYLIFDNPETLDPFELWKPIVLGIIAVNLIGLYSSDVWRRHVFATTTTSLCLAFATVGYSFGLLNDPGGPWFQVLFFIPITTVLLPVNLMPRLLATNLVTLSFITGFLVEYPAYIHHPYAQITLLVTGGLILISTFIGHVYNYLIREEFLKDRGLRHREIEMKHMARHDLLTGLNNRRHFEALYHKEFKRAKRYGETFSILMLDLDHFKDVNDEYGHRTGDRVLKEVGSIIQDEIRTPDIASRYGGEEFAIVLPETDLPAARELGERLRNRIKEIPFHNENGSTFHITCSLGVAEYDNAINNPDELITRADKALYRSKRQGRDQLSTADAGK